MVRLNPLSAMGKTSRDIIRLAIAIALPLGAGALGSVFTAESVSSWYQTVEKPWFTPPSWLFGPAWTILYVLMGVALFVVWKRIAATAHGIKSPRAVLPFVIFGAQLALNVLWSFLFFGLRSPQLAFAEIMILLASIALTIAVFSKVSKLAGSLLLPYAAWVIFASLLNFEIWMLNSPSNA
jgi:tryptophan-rich sensory protein